MRIQEINQVDHVALFEAVTAGMGRVGQRNINMKALQQAWERSGKPADLVGLWKFLRRAGLSDEQAQQAFKSIGVEPEHITMATKERPPTAQEPRVGSWYARQREGAAGRPTRSPNVDRIAQMVQAHPGIYEEVRKMLSRAFREKKQLPAEQRAQMPETKMQQARRGVRQAFQGGQR